MDARIRHAVRNYLVSGDPRAAETALNAIIRSGVLGDLGPKQTCAWGTLPFDPENPPRTAHDLYMTQPDRIEVPDGEYQGVHWALSHVPEVDSYYKADEFAYLIHVHHYVDRNRGDYSFDLAGVFFDGEPTFIFQNAGKDGRDHRQKYITHPENYIAMLHYILDLPPRDNLGEANPWGFRDEDLIDPDAQDERLFVFYGYDARSYMDDPL